MTESDQSLIDKASQCHDWSMVSNIETQAESEECKIILHNRKVDLYHREERFANID